MNASARDPAAAPFLQLTSRGARAPATDAPVVALADEFRVRRCVRITSLIDPALVSTIAHRIDRASFTERAHGAIATEMAMAGNSCLALLYFLVNDPVVFQFVERVTGVRPITFFNGRVYRRLPGGRHRDSWHTDVHPDRRIGMSVNLGTAAYEGGLFEIREEDAPAPLGSIANTGTGDAILFMIADGLEHRVTDLQGHVAKTAFAGWFGATHDFQAAFRKDPFLPDGI